LLGIAAAFASRSLLQNKSSVASSTAGGTVAANLNIPARADSAPSLPPANAVQAVDQSIAKAEPVPPAVEDPEKIAVLISTLSEAEVCKWLGTLAGQDLTGNTGRLLLRRWVELDPAAAVNWLAQLNDPAAHQELADVVAVAWSEKDLPNALAWVESLPEGATKHQALTDLGYEVARVDPVDAMQIATQLPAGDNADSLLLHSLAQYASADPAQSQQLALSLPQGPLRDQALSTVATVQARQDGAGAAQFAVQNISPGPGLDNAVIGVVQLWAQTDLTGAALWVQSFPVSPIRDQAVQSLDMISLH